MRERQKKYEASPKGRATKRRYRMTAKGMLSDIKRTAKKRGSP